MRPALVLLSLTLAGSALAEPGVRIDREVVASEPRTAALEVLGPGAALSEPDVTVSLTGTHVRYRTLAADGTPVVGEELAVHLDGAAPRFRARLLDEPARGVWAISGSRRIGEAQALALAEAAAGGRARRAEAVARPVARYLARPAWRVLVDAGPARLLEVWVDAGDGSVELGDDLLWHVSGSGMVYRPNPVAIFGSRGLVDSDDADTTTLTMLREQVELQGLDGTGNLKGELVDARNPASRAFEPSLVFNYTRSQKGFEEVNAYYHVDRVQRQIADLGFTGVKRLKLVLPFVVLVNALADDQSYYDPDLHQIRTGLGGVDDGEDADVLIHEFGHAVQDAVVAGFGRNDDSKALGEGFADIQAYAMTELTAKTPIVARECLAAWDSTAYDPPSPCMRRVDGVKHYPEHLRAPREQHYDGEIWSGALHDMFAETGLGPQGGYRLVLESTSMYSIVESLPKAAEALLLADQSLYGGQHVDAIKRAMTRHGLLSAITPEASSDGPWQALPAETFESTHPIAPTADLQKTITKAGAKAMRVSFARINMELGTASDRCPSGYCDAIYIYDGDGRLYARLGGAATALVGPAVPGDTIVVRWVTNGVKPSDGFVVDKVEAASALSGPPDAGPTPLPDAGTMVVPPGGDPAGSCGCRADGGRGGARPWLLLVAIAGAAAAVRRRRRSRS